MIRWPGFRHHKPQAVPDGTQAALGTSAGNRVRCATGEADNLRKQRCSLARRHFLILPGLHPGNHPNIPVCSPLQYAPQQPVSSVPVIVRRLFQNDTAVPGEESRGYAQINPAIAHMVLIVPCTIPHSPGASFFIVVIRRHPFFCKKRVLHRPIGGGPSPCRPTAERRPQKIWDRDQPNHGCSGMESFGAESFSAFFCSAGSRDEKSICTADSVTWALLAAWRGCAIRDSRGSPWNESVLRCFSSIVRS